MVEARILKSAPISGGRSSSESEVAPGWEARALAAQAAAAPMVASVDRWAARAVDALAHDRAGALPDAVLDGARQLGLFGLRVPLEWGGLGLGVVESAAVLTGLARHDRSLATTLGLHAGLGLEALRQSDDSALRERWLPRLATGEIIAAFAATEAGAGSHIAAVATTVRAGADGRDALTGEKLYVTNGGLAGVFTVLARTPEHGGPHSTALLLVPRDAPGIEIGPEERKLGLRASSTTSVRFEGTPIEASSWLSAPGTGLEGMHAVLDVGRTFMAAGCLGTARAAFARTLDHVRLRHQFGRPLAHFAAVRSRLARASAWLLGVEAGLLHAASGLDAAAAGDASADTSWACAALKVLASEVAWQVADDAIQLHGGAGFIEDTGVALLLRDSRVTRIFEGANDVLRLRVGVAALDRRSRPAGPPVPERLSAVAERLDQLDAAVDTACAAQVAKNGRLRLLGDQPRLLAIADAAIARWAARAALDLCATRHRQGELDDKDGARVALLVELATRSARASLEQLVEGHALEDAAAHAILG